MKLTKLAIKKLSSAPIETRIWNGNYKNASIRIHNNKHEWELSYDLSHPMLEIYSRKHDEAQLVCWKGHTGTVIDIPDSIQPIVDKLRLAASMTIDEALHLELEMQKVVNDYHKAMYGE